MSDNDPLARMSRLFESWTAKHDPRQLPAVLGTLKGRITRTYEQRLEKKKWAIKMEPIMVDARNDLGAGATNRELVDWLNDRGHSKSNGERFGTRNFKSIFDVSHTITALAVEECRTKMSALALSAEFTGSREEVEPLESECIATIKDGILLERSLHGTPLSKGADIDLMAQEAAKEEARRQREDADYLPMLARECYLTLADFNAAVPDIEQMILQRRLMEPGDKPSRAPMTVEEAARLVVRQHEFKLQHRRWDDTVDGPIQRFDVWAAGLLKDALDAADGVKEQLKREASAGNH